MDIKKMTTDMVLRALQDAGVRVVQVTDRQARLFLKSNAGSDRAQFSLGGDGIVSNASLALASISKTEAPAAQWLSLLQKAGGIKAAEDLWTGLSDWLKSQGQQVLTRQTVSDYIASHAIRLREEEFIDAYQFDGFTKELQREFNDYIGEAEEQTGSIYMRDLWQYAFDRMAEEYGDDFEQGFGYTHGVLYVNDRECAARVLGLNPINGTRLEYTTPDLDNKKEIALYVPDIEPWAVDDDIHFSGVGDGRCIAWVRFGETSLERPFSPQERQDRLDAMPGAERWQLQCFDSPYVDRLWTPPVKDAKYPKAHISISGGQYRIWDVPDMLSVSFPTLDRAVQAYNRHVCPIKDVTRILVIDEVQSQRHQQGRKNGYVPAGVLAEYDRLRRGATADMSAYYDRLRELKVQNGIEGALDEEVEARWQKEDTLLAGLYDRMKLSDRTCTAFRRSHSEMDTVGKDDGLVPDAPFRKNWHELCMKRMLRYAAEHGFDRVAWTTGEQQAQRYGVSRHIAHIDIQTRRTDGHMDKQVTLLYKNAGNTVFHLDDAGIISGLTAPLDKANGKHVSKLLGSSLGAKVMATGWGEISGDGLVIGGEGLRKFYDGVLPNYMDHYCKRWGVSTGSTQLSLDGADFTFHSVDVTPDMQASVMQSQPMFMKNERGQVYGWALDGTIYLTPRGLNAETAIHEYTHLWADCMRQLDKKGWKHIKSLLRGTALWDQVVQDGNYRHLRGNDDALASEVLARVSGRDNAAKLQQAVRQATERDRSLSGLDRVKQALGQFWSWVGRHVFSLRQARTVSDVTDRILGDLLRGVTPLRQGADRVSDIQVRQFGDKSYGTYRMRCRIDGQQQTYVDLSRGDAMRYNAATDPLERQSLGRQLAEKYFSSQLGTAAQQPLTKGKRL